jgi:hypothetical protein
MTTLPNLPILTKDNKETYLTWHLYYERVYKEPISESVDLNNFNWFYWFSPLGNINTLKINEWHNGKYGLHAPLSWRNCKINQTYVFNYNHNYSAETQLSKVGFFVKRNIDINILNNPFLEVYRTCQSIFIEKGVCWFFLTIGSGYYLKCDKNTVFGCRKIPNWIEDNPYSCMISNNIKIFILQDSFFRDVGLIELLYCLDNETTEANTADLPLFIGNTNKIPYNHKYDKTKCMC